MKVKVPTMRELKKAAKAIGAEVDLLSWAPYGRGGDVWVTPPKGGCGATFSYDRYTSYSHACYLAGRHIEALKEMEEAGL